MRHPVFLLLRTKRKRAFTVLELLIVIVVLGILAGLMLLKFDGVNDKAFIATMQSDLRNFATSRALYIAEEGSAPGAVAQVAQFDFSKGVFNNGYQNVSASRWALSVGHSKSKQRCTLNALNDREAQVIRCIPQEGITFTADVEGMRVDVDASPAIAEMAFAPTTDRAFQLLAASVEDIERVTWSWGDGSPDTSGPAAEEFIRTFHEYDMEGEYEIELTLIMKTGNTEKGVRSLNVIRGSAAPNMPPVVSFEYDIANPSEGEEIIFTSTSYDPENQGMTYEWDFGDGTTGSEWRVGKVYTEPGVYLVQLRVQDEGGKSATITKNVRILVAPTVLYEETNPNFTSWDKTYSRGEADGYIRFNLTNNGTKVSRVIATGALPTPHNHNINVFHPLSPEASTASFSGVVGDRTLEVTARLRADAQHAGKTVGICAFVTTHGNVTLQFGQRCDGASDANRLLAGGDFTVEYIRVVIR